MPLKAMKGHAHKGCWTCPRLPTRVLLSSGQRKTRERKGGEGGHPGPGKGVCPSREGSLSQERRPARSGPSHEEACQHISRGRCWVKSGSLGPGVFTAGDGVRERPQETKPVAEEPGGALQPIQQPRSHALGNSAPWWTHGEASEVQVAQSSDSLRPQGLQPARLLCPWDSPGKNTGVGSRSLLQGIFPTQG